MKISGKDLIAMGYPQGKWFKAALAYVNENELRDEALRNYLDAHRPNYVLPHSEAKPYHKNIKAENELEASNMASVFQTMDTLMRTPTLLEGAVMPDACPTGGNGQIPVGGIAVAENAIHPAMHSADICCSVMMTSFGKVDPKKVLDAAQSSTHFGPGGRAEFSRLPKEINDRINANPFLNAERSKRLAREHLGTQGDGNHFLFVGVSEQSGETIMVTHHGSRGFGALLYKKGMKTAESFRRELSPKTQKLNAWIPADSTEGIDYWQALQIVRAWTKLNHQVLHESVEQQLKVDSVFNFWNEHNFIFRKDNLFYHAKGATPLDDNFVPDSTEGLRLVPLNMSQPILVVKGATTDNNLGFAPHGAGRNVSRSQHIRSKAARSIESIFAEETKGLDVRFFSGNIDISELPSAYKDADTVQQQMADFNLGEIKDRIMPYGCIMAGDWQKDAPWRKRKRQ